MVQTIHLYHGNVFYLFIDKNIRIGYKNFGIYGYAVLIGTGYCIMIYFGLSIPEPKKALGKPKAFTEKVTNCISLNNIATLNKKY